MGSISIAASSAILLLLLLLLPLLMLMTPRLPSSYSSYFSLDNQSNNKVCPLLVNFKTERPLLQLLMLIASSSSAVVVVVTIWLMRSWAKGKKEGVNLLRLRRQQNDDNNSSSNSNNNRLPPGRQGMPVIGETLKLIAAYKTEDPEPFIDERVKRNGSRLFTSHVFGETTVFSADPEFNRLVVGGEGRTFECSYPSSISTLLGKHSLVLMKGSLHKRMHSLSITRFSSLSVLRRALLPDIDRLVSTTLDSWSAASDDPGTGTGGPLLLLDQAKKITFELTVKQLMSCDPGEWTEALRREYLLLIDGFFSIPFPSFLSFTTYGRAIQARMKVAEKLRGVVRKRKEKRKRNGGEGINDMLDELMEAEEGFSEEEMVDFLLALLVAGYETTPTIMTLVVKFLTDNPSALSLLREEHDDIRAKKKHKSDPLEWSDYKDMRFTQCVINETLRVVNIVSGVFRRATSDIHFKGYRIPKGCKVFASFRAVHMDPENFKDARTFNPWRWQTRCENGVFTPFGGGARLCPGYELARLEISIFIHHLVTRFSWDMAEQDRLIFFPTTRLVKGYPITVHRREVCDTYIHI